MEALANLSDLGYTIFALTCVDARLPVSEETVLTVTICSFVRKISPSVTQDNRV